MLRYSQGSVSKVSDVDTFRIYRSDDIAVRG